MDQQTEEAPKDPELRQMACTLLGGLITQCKIDAYDDFPEYLVTKAVDAAKKLKRELDKQGL